MSLLNTQTENSPATEKPLQRWLMFAVLILASLFCLANNIADPDLWGHVQFGRDVVRTGEIQPTTTYSYTANGYRWINHENLSELGLALTYDNLGIAGLIVGKFLLAILILSLVVWTAARNQVGLMVSGMVAFLLATNLTSFWHFRPQVSSFVCCALMLTILESCFRDWQTSLDKHSSAASSEIRTRWLWFIPVILFVWANSHGGFVAGLAIFGAYIGGRIIELWISQGKQSYGLSLRLALTGIAGLLATFVNPYGPNLHLWLMNSLGEPRPEIQDWLAVDFSSANGIRFAVILMLTAVATFASNRKKDWTKIAILALVAWQACSHVRHVAFFGLLFGFWMPTHIQATVQRFKNSLANIEKPTEESPSNSIQWVTGIIAIIMIGLIAFRMQDIPVDKAKYPVEAFEFIADHDLDGRMVVTYNWAQYVIGAFGGEHQHLPVCPVSFDGRFRTCYPQEIVDMNFDFVIFHEGPKIRFRGTDSGPVDATKALEFGEPELVLISRRQEPAIDVMQEQHENWCLLYQDKIAQLWGVKSRFNDPSSDSYLTASKRSISEREQSGFVSWPALPSKSPQSQPSGLASNAITVQ